MSISKSDPRHLAASLMVVVGVLAVSASVCALEPAPASSEAAFFDGLKDIRSQVGSQKLHISGKPELALPQLDAAPGCPNGPEFAVVERGVEFDLYEVGDLKAKGSCANASAVGQAAADWSALYDGTLRKKAPSFTIQRKGEAYFIYGSGVATPGGNIGWRGLQIGYKEKVSDRVSLGVVHINEGHPVDFRKSNEKNHRDGFAVMGWFEQPVGGRANIQAGAGPYFSMNTMNKDKKEYNEKNLGLLASLAVVYRLTESGMGVRAQYNFVMMPNSFDTHTGMLGVSQELGDESNAANGSAGGTDASENRISIWGGVGVTNRSGQEVDETFAGLVEFSQAINPYFAYSVSGVWEGDTGLSNRVGVAGQLWYVAPRYGKWDFRAGIGPYVAMELKTEDKGAKFLGLISFQASRQIYKNWSIGIRFNRTVTPYDKDADMFLVGITWAFPEDRGGV